MTKTATEARAFLKQKHSFWLGFLPMGNKNGFQKQWGIEKQKQYKALKYENGIFAALFEKSAKKHQPIQEIKNCFVWKGRTVKHGFW